MAKRRRGLNPRERAELWQRWRAGQSLSDIGRALQKAAASVYAQVATHGGFSPPMRMRNARSLTTAEREEISRGLGRGESLRSIGARIGRHPSTISREVARNSGSVRYRASQADARAWKEARRPKSCKLASNGWLRRAVSLKLSQNWSPEQIAGWLSRTFPMDQTKSISHETIYKSLFVQARGVLKKELLSHLRTRRRMRHGRTATTKGQTRGQIIDAIPIRERPAEVEDRAVPGHWEGDLVSGCSNSHIATLVERQSRFTMLVKLAGKDAESVCKALKQHVGTLPEELRCSLTWDRGSEMARHTTFSAATDMKVYFCDPRSPWQRGTNENTNGLLRQYFPKGENLSLYTQSELNRVARALNARPRKTLGFMTPADKLEQVLR